MNRSHLLADSILDEVVIIIVVVIIAVVAIIVVGPIIDTIVVVGAIAFVERETFAVIIVIGHLVGISVCSHICIIRIVVSNRMIVLVLYYSRIRAAAAVVVVSCGPIAGILQFHRIRSICVATGVRNARIVANDEGIETPFHCPACTLVTVGDATLLIGRIRNQRIHSMHVHNIAFILTRFYRTVSGDLVRGHEFNSHFLRRWENGQNFYK